MSRIRCGVCWGPSALVLALVFSGSHKVRQPHGRNGTQQSFQLEVLALKSPTVRFRG